ncbi:glycerophosphodiester phosphodiesterase [Viridibacillus sp. FSL R5-0477]|uniref:Glycerophosphoryl diester phosphodiesterase n=1 Tax=Viridibacillus arenosi FSL R5-213 TaxID=1227360 RepID=W4EZU5_9BACL|nr:MULTISPECIES: glycerophosphodiester phosphodiesterase [Viridibacillus]ETT85744.1 glycerophosphoryl diester phosphodiesterase [Viridibacillus arenosi FSL R5-213]OMC82999.1 glycerophosphodiester phosphodiesterase [Viridibacillus sp. FSL H8-0123]OMC88917.1 glycerophosphodiester phosphodiesterase [Viridibacillus sp. FSL H7-0596]OMC93546.1 glycerophosphodiester phosphodiesterase [Viridibacillus arenosi]
MGKKTKVAIAIAAASAAAWAGSKALSKPQKRSDKDALQYDQPIVLAHRGGSHLAPEHTMSAFHKAADLGVHGFEIDIRLTKDEEIVVFHDEYVDRTCDGTGRVADLTLEELQLLNFGYNFVDLDGYLPYREDKQSIVTLRSLLEEFPQMLVNIDMKDAPDTYEGGLMPSKLWRLIEELGVENRVVVTSFFDEQIDRFNLYAQNKVALGAGQGEVKKAYTSFTSQFGHLYHPKVDVFQIPSKFGVFALDNASFIRFLENLNIPVHYWTINDVSTMEQLLSVGAKGIVTDRPDLAIELLNE